MIRLASVFLISIFLTTSYTTSAFTASTEMSLVQQSFANWQKGESSPFELLADDVRWTIMGSGQYAKSYDKQTFMKDIVYPFNTLLAKPLKPEPPELYQREKTVIAVFSANSQLLTGEPYFNNYVWIMEFQNDKIIEVSAYLDLVKFEKVLLHRNTDKK